MTDLILNGNNGNTNNGSTLGVPESSTSTTSSSKLYVPGQEGIVASSKELWVPEEKRIVVPSRRVDYPDIIIHRVKQFRKLLALYLDEDGTLYNSIGILQSYFMALIRDLDRLDLSTEALEFRQDNIDEWKSIKDELISARDEGREPNVKSFGDLKKLAEIIDTDDAPKTIDQKIEAAEFRVWLSQHDLDMLKEQRDTLLEIDGKKSKGENGIIPYDIIYSKKYWYPGLEKNVRDIVNYFGKIAKGYTAHNGIDDMHGREFDEKKDPLIAMGLKEHIGLRFHPYEHQDNGKYRPRNPKGLNLMKAYGFENLNGQVILEDTLEVCKEMYSRGASVIYVNRKGTTDTGGFYTIYDPSLENIIQALITLGFDSDDDYVYRIPNDEKSRVYVKDRN